MMADMVSVSHLSKSFESQPVIDDLTFAIPAGGRTAVFAPSGAGKTTLIQILAGLQKPDTGTVRVNVEHPVVLFQEPRLFPYMTVEENILLPFKLRDRAVTMETLQSFNSWLSVCGLKEFKKHYPYQLSGGMKQKVSLIRGLLQNPSFIMMDEPFQSIGREAKKIIIEHLLKTYPNLTVLLVTHDPEEVQQLAQQMLFFPTAILGRYACVNTHDAKFQQFRFSGFDLPDVEPNSSSAVLPEKNLLNENS
jgi:ABC-type nitrate/sulfonate/bicarbonate transport system ATPase subunit